MGRTCSTYGVRRGAYRVLVGKPEGRRPLGRPRHRWEHNIKMDTRYIRDPTNAQLVHKLCICWISYISSKPEMHTTQGYKLKWIFKRLDMGA
jgi:hypothetical protein